RPGGLRGQAAAAAPEHGDDAGIGQAASPPGRLVADDGPTAAPPATRPTSHRTAPRRARVTGAAGAAARRLASRESRRVARGRRPDLARRPAPARPRAGGAAGGAVAGCLAGRAAGRRRAGPRPRRPGPLPGGLVARRVGRRARRWAARGDRSGRYRRPLDPHRSGECGSAPRRGADLPAVDGPAEADRGGLLVLT